MRAPLDAVANGVRDGRDARKDHVRHLLVHVEREGGARGALEQLCGLDDAERLDRSWREPDALHDERDGEQQAEGHHGDEGEEADRAAHLQVASRDHAAFTSAQAHAA